MRLPEGWKILPIGDIAKVTSGGTPDRANSEYWNNGNIPWVTTGEISFTEIENTNEKITEIGLKNSSAKLFPKDTILMAMYGQGKTRGQVAKLGISASTNQACAAIILKSEYNPDYYFQYLWSKYENLRDIGNEGTQKNLNGGLIKEVLVPVPPLPEQQKIAQIISTWDKAIEKLETLIAAKQKRKKALMQQLLTGKKRFSGFDGEWKAFRLGDLFEERNETRFHDLNLLSITREKGVIPRNEVERKDTSNEDKSKYLRICPGDIGYNTMRMWQGVSAVSDLEGIVSPAYTVCKPRNNVDGKFIAFLFKLTYFMHLFQRNSQGLTSDTWNLKFRHFSKIKVKIPMLLEQQKIAAVLSIADKEIAIHQNQLTTLKQQKKGLMQQLLTGKKRVNVGKVV